MSPDPLSKVGSGDEINVPDPPFQFFEGLAPRLPRKGGSGCARDFSPPITLQKTQSAVQRYYCHISLVPRPHLRSGDETTGTSVGVEVYTAPGMKAHFRLAFD